MRTFATFLHATSDTATALLHIASASVALGAAAAIGTQQLRYGLIVCAATLVVAVTGLGVSLWRTYHPHRRRHAFLARRARASHA